MIIRIQFILLFLLSVCCSTFTYAADDNAIPVLEKELKTARGQERFYLEFELSELYIPISIDTSLKYGDQALKTATEIKDKLLEARALENLGNIYIAKQDWSEAINYYTKAKDAFIILKSDRLYIDIIIKLSDIYQRAEDFEKAQKFLEEGIVYIRDSANIARFRSRIGYVYYKLNDFEKALYYYNLSKNYYSCNNFYYKTIEVIDNIGLLYNDWGKFANSISCYQQTLQLYTNLKDKAGIISSYFKLANEYYIAGNIDSAEIFINAVINTDKEIHYKEVLSNTYILLGQIHKSRSQWYQAINDFNKSIELANDINNNKVKVDNFLNLYEVYYELKNYEKALEFYVNYNTMLEFDQGTNSLASQLETKYAIEKNEKQLELNKRESELQNLRLSKQQNMLYLSIVGFLLLIVIIGLIYRQSVIRKRTNTILEQQKEEILKINEELKQQSEEILAQKEMLQDAFDTIEVKSNLLERTNMELMDNIRYAQRIQGSILPQGNYISKLLPDHFVFFRPRDILSGDFFWVQKQSKSIVSKNESQNVLVAAVDCTGHGVSGALLSIVGNNLLNQAVFEHHITKPGEILDFMNQQIFHIWEYTQVKSEIRVNDGMDMALINLDLKNNKLNYAGAKNPLCLIRKKELTLYNATKQAIGERSDIKAHVKFEDTEIHLKEGDSLYMFSDGYGDQFGGPNNKKFKDARLFQLLIDIADMPMEKQKPIIHETFENWKGENEQIDDVLIIGIKV